MWKKIVLIYAKLYTQKNKDGRKCPNWFIFKNWEFDYIGLVKQN